MATEETNFYDPDGVESDQLASAKGSKQTVSWTASEFIEHNVGAGWYTLLFLVTVALAAIVYFVIHDYFATAVIVILGVIVGFYAGHKPGQVDYEVDRYGLKVGDRTYRYGEFKSFSIIHEGALSTITFYPLKRWALPLSIFFDAKDGDRIANMIGDHLPLDSRGPDRFDSLTRRLKL
jgi:hypothetical protein